MSNQLLSEFDRAMSINDDSVSGELFAGSENQIQKRFSIYREGYGIRTRSAMEEMYPRLSKLMGEEWLKLGGQYIKEHPSEYFDISAVGSKMPEFLIGHQVPLLWQELAELEYMVWKTFHAAQVPNQISLSRLGEITAESKFIFSETTALFGSHAGAISAWLGLEHPEQREYGAIYRSGFDVDIYFLKPEEYLVLWKLKEHMALGEALAEASLEAEQLAQWLNSWISKNFFCDFR